MNSFFDFCNSIQGFITLIGLFLIIPFAILSDRFIAYLRNKKHRKELQQLLLHEIWVNMNFAYSMEKSYNKNLLASPGTYVPRYSPRTEIISKFFEFDLINSLNYDDKCYLVEIFTQLEGLKKEFEIWKEKVLFCDLCSDRALYETISSTMLDYIDVLMKNCMDLWIGLVMKFGKYSKINKIRDFYSKLIGIKKEGRKFKYTYKASFYNTKEYENIDFDLIICWVDDFKDSKREVFEIRNIVPLHDSWKTE